jgi:hypothetical protein
MAQEQELNSLERFRKRSARLVLEEHGHCEVPAGCGGVVLRWRAPEHLTCPVTIYSYSPTPVECRIDGAEPESSHGNFPVGRHALTFLFAGVDPAAVLLVCAAVQDLRRPVLHLPPGLADRALKVLTADDDAWKYALGPAGDDAWLTPAFDDSAWPALVRAAAPPTPDQREPGSWNFRRAVELGAVFLGLLPGAPGPATVRVRRSFEILAPLGPEPQT